MVWCVLVLVLVIGRMFGFCLIFDLCVLVVMLCFLGVVGCCFVCVTDLFCFSYC